MTRRKFHRRIYLGILKRQRLICGCRAACTLKLTRATGFQFNHMVALCEGGKDVPGNIAAVSVEHHKPLTKLQAFERAKAKRIARKLAGTWRKPKGQPMTSRGFNKRLRKRFDGTVEVIK